MQLRLGPRQGRAAPPRPGPTSHPPLQVAGKTRSAVPVERKHCACPVAGPGAGCPKEGFPRLPKLDPCTRVRGRWPGELAFRRGSLPPSPTARHTSGGEQPGAAPPAGMGTTLAGEGARGGIAVTRDCPRRFGQPSSARPRAASKRDEPDNWRDRRRAPFSLPRPPAGLCPPLRTCLTPP